MARKKQKKEAPTEEPGGGFGGLGSLLAEAGLSASASPAPTTASTPKPEKTAATAKASSDLSDQPKLVVRRERSGRGGKTVTVVEGLRLSDDARTALCKRMKKKLGTGATVQDADIVVQGALVERVASWLEAEGASKVVRGN